MNRRNRNGKEYRGRSRACVISMLCLSLMAASLAGCGTDAGNTEEPATERAPIDTRKTVRNLVDQAENGAYSGKADRSTEETKQADYTTDDAKAEDGKASAMKEIDHFETKLESENGLMKVEVDAPVRVSECDAYPILSVTRSTIDNELLKKTKQLLLGDTQLYDGVRLYEPYIEDSLAKGEEPDPAWDLSGRVPYAEIGKYPVDTELVSVKDAASKYADNGSFKDYYMSMMSDGELFYGVTDGKDGSYANLAVTSSERYGSSLKFIRSTDYNVRSGLVLPGVNLYGWPVEKGTEYLYDEKNNPTMPVGMPSKMEEVTLPDGTKELEGNGTTDPDFLGCKVRISPKETNGLTKEEAASKAEQLLKDIGLSDEFVPTVVQEEYITDPEHIDSPKDANGKYAYEFTVGRAWHIVFQRSVNGNILEDYGEKYTYKGPKRVWFGEVVEVYVNDNGIIGLSVNDPLKVQETVVENGKLLDFDQIRKIYEESQLESLNHSTSFDSILNVTKEEAEQTGEGGYTFKIDDICLTYTRVTDQKEFSRALLVPVWSFRGTCYGKDGNVVAEGSFLEINAVDGSVYNAEVGY